MDNSRTVSLPLAEIEHDRDLVITRVTGSGTGHLRLRELGMCEGRRVRVLCPADPMICMVDQCRVGLDRCLAEQILVCPLAHKALV